MVGIGERQVRRSVVVPDPLHERGETFLARSGLLEVDQLRHVGWREAVLVLEPRDVLARGDPAVLLPVDTDEHVALREVGTVELAGRMRARTELEHDRGEMEALDRTPRGRPLGLELPERGAHEDPQQPVGRADRRTVDAVAHVDVT